MSQHKPLEKRLKQGPAKAKEQQRVTGAFSSIRTVQIGSLVVLINCLRAFRDGMFGELSWKEESHRSFHLATRESLTPRRANQFGRLGRDLIQDLCTKTIHNA